jgi:translocator protein
MKKINLLISVLISLTAGILSYLISVPDQPGIYEGLARPWFTIPSGLFLPVWVLMYLLMGIAAGTVYESPSPIRTKVLILYVVQLFGNFLWPLVFFGLAKICFSVSILAMVLALMLVTAYRFHEACTRAGVLMALPVIWTAYILIMNISICFLNI